MIYKRCFIVTLLGLYFTTGIQASPFCCSGMRNLKDLEYDFGLLEAKKGNYETSMHLLKAGWNRSGSRIFLSQLAGVSYRMGEQEQAKQYLFEILKRDPNDQYANDFLGALFLLQGNLEACLKYWNRVGKPLIENIEIRPQPRVDPEIMDRAFAMAPASQLKLEDYLATDLRLETMDIFRRFQFELKPYKDQEKFDLVFQPRMKKSSLGSRLEMAQLAGDAIFNGTIKPEFHNIGGTTISSTSLISWDEFKNRFYTSLSLPLGNEPHQRIDLFVDARKETWVLPSEMDLNKWEAGVEIGESLNSRMKWSGGTKVSRRYYDGPVSLSSQAFQEGWSMHVFGRIDDSMVRIPEKRVDLSSSSNAEIGKFLGSTSFVTFQESLNFHWFPHPTGDDLEMNARFRAGKIFGAAPFDEYFVLGVERDTDLLLRAHKSDIDRKGENPFGPAYLLWNWDVSKNVMNQGLLRWKFAPFVDVGKVFDSDLWKEDQWLVDAGIQSRFQILKSSEVILTYGKDLRTGRNVVYLHVNL